MLDLQKNQQYLSARSKNILLLLFLFIAVLIANIPILTNDILYPEQPTLYLVNQSIHSFADLLNVYLHPKGLDDVIPFFRPSGHFLIYQLLIPIFGWHNTRALIVVNMLFLTLTGWMMIKIYQRLFPGYKIGGYLAFGFYCMHPALILSRFLLMHFEFAHVFFLMLGLYCFILFCQKNASALTDAKQVTALRHYSYLFFALLLYAIAITFKESALMLGPVMAAYFVLCFARQWMTRQGREIILLLVLVTVSLSVYLTLAWPHLAHPQSHPVLFSERIAVLNQFLKNLLGSKINFLTHTELPFYNGVIWRSLVFSPAAHIIVWIFLLAGILNSLRVLFKKQNAEIKRSILFLWVAVALFLVLPCAWAVALPWHWNLSILFLSLILGLGVDVFLQKYVRNVLVHNSVAAVLFVSFVLIAVQINTMNLANVLRLVPTMQLTRNAIFHPPPIQNQLQPDSLILIATQPEEQAYMLGNAKFGYGSKKDVEYDETRKSRDWLYRQYDANYNGTLFKWAYLLPNLREELFPFALNKMQDVPNEAIYRWLTNYNSIFCFVTDNEKNTWHDVTQEFKKNLLREEARRHLVVSVFTERYAERINGTVFNKIRLPYPDHQICQYACDQNIICKGFTYTDEEAADKAVVGCEFYNSILSQSGSTFCASCRGFLKHASL